MPTAPQIDAPVSLGSFFPPDSDEEEETELDQCFETQEVILADETLRVRQFAYHSHNANRVWPGTFNLADYLFEKDDEGKLKHQWGSVVELGTATGLLAIRLAKSSSVHGDNKPVQEACCASIITSDYGDDELGSHVRHNFEINGFDSDKIPVHVPHTWGTGWEQSALKQGVGEKTFDTIVASDILLYVSAYAALVETLLELMSPKTHFIMSWNRRMKESSEFFDRMKGAGFDCVHVGKCVYIFTVKSTDQNEEDVIV